MRSVSGDKESRKAPTVIVRYSAKKGELLDWDYYENSHLGLVRRLLTPHGLTGFTIDRPVEASVELVASVSLEFEDMERLLRGLDAVGHELAADVGNFFSGSTSLTIAERTRGH